MTTTAFEAYTACGSGTTTVNDFSGQQIALATIPTALQGRTVTFSVWVRNDWVSGADGLVAVIDGDQTTSVNLSDAGGWQRVVVTHIISALATQLGVRLAPSQAPTEAGRDGPIRVTLQI